MRRKRFFGQRVDVRSARTEAGIDVPCEFVLGDETVRIVEVLRRWHDSGFAETSRRRTWLDRRHRTHYRIRTQDGSICELYVDRSGGRRDWYLVSRTPSPSPATSPTRTSGGEHPEA